MNRWKFLCIVLLLALIFLVFFYVKASMDLASAQELVEKYVADKLKEQGYQEGTYEPPKITDAPIGSKPLLHVTGKVHYAPVPAIVTGVQPLQPSADAPASLVPVAGPVVQRENPCNLDELDVTIGCTVDAMSQPGRPFARMLASGEITGWGQTRILPEMPSGEIHLEVAPSAKPKTWGLDFLAGAAIGSRNGIELGLSGIGKSRLGWYSLVEYQFPTGGTAYDANREATYSTGSPSTWRLHGGLRIRVK